MTKRCNAGFASFRGVSRTICSLVALYRLSCTVRIRRRAKLVCLLIVVSLRDDVGRPVSIRIITLVGSAFLVVSTLAYE